MERVASDRTHQVPLSTYLAAHGPLDTTTAVQILELAAQKLDAAHAAGVVHGQVGPGAVLLDLNTGTVGIREPAGSPSPEVGYVAPEVRRGEEPDAAADIYAVGALLALCLTGRTPPGDRELPTMGLPAGAAEVITQSMHPNPASRHESCGAVLDDLYTISGAGPDARVDAHDDPDHLLDELDELTGHGAGEGGMSAAMADAFGLAQSEPGTTATRSLLAPAPRPRSGDRGWLAAQRARPRRVLVLTAATLVVVAVAGMAAALVGRPGGTNPQARDELIATIGLSGCRDTPGLTTGGADGLLAAVDCDPDGAGVQTVSYRRYADAGRLQAAYRAGVAALAPVSETSCSAVPAPPRAQAPYELHGTYLGNVLCDRTSGTPSTTWTVDGLRLLGTATGPDASALDRWLTAHLMHRPWTSQIVRSANETADPPFPTPSEAALIARIPAASQVDCSRLDRQFVIGNAGSADGVIGIACGPTAGARTVFYLQFADADRFAAFRGAGPGTAADCQAGPPQFSGSAHYTRTDGRTGILGCVQQRSAAAIVWTDDATRIAGFAFGDSPEPLLDWWRTQGGPA